MGLIYYPDSQPGIRRHRRGRGFSYVGPDGTRIDRGEERARIKALAVPPAYDDVWICPQPNGHLQATGRDARRRKQYRYHPDWSADRAVRKYDQLTDLGLALPRLRRWITSRLAGDIGDAETAIAAVLALIDRASLRVGHPDYTAENGTYGATTLRNRHINFDGTNILLSYKAKGGKEVQKRVQGAQLQRVLQKSGDLPGRELISWQDDEGRPHAVRSEQIQQVLSNLCGDKISAKSLRTWNGTHAAFQAACQTETTLTIGALADAAASRLHNTPTIARNSYIHPDVIALAEMENAERLNRLSKLESSLNPDQYRKGEAELLAFLI